MPAYAEGAPVPTNQASLAIVHHAPSSPCLGLMRPGMLSSHNLRADGIISTLQARIRHILEV